MYLTMRTTANIKEQKEIPICIYWLSITLDKGIATMLMKKRQHIPKFSASKSRKTKCDAVIKRNANFLCKTKCDNIECTHRRKSQTLDFPV